MHIVSVSIWNSKPHLNTNSLIVSVDRAFGIKNHCDLYTCNKVLLLAIGLNTVAINSISRVNDYITSIVSKYR